ncbi:hypothetical protein GCM10020001_098790 [Nonomuraea salmonea]
MTARRRTSSLIASLSNAANEPAAMPLLVKKLLGLVDDEYEASRPGADQQLFNLPEQTALAFDELLANFGR